MEKFLFFNHYNLDAYFNLALEEYLLKQKTGSYIYLWQNDNSVIIGVNQNAFNEINFEYTNKNNVKVVRRLTGGGAVYHDIFNVNYTIIEPFNKDEDSYVKFTKPVIDYLNSIGVKAEFSGRNDVCIDGKKISGNAQTIYKDRILHHGTLLFSSNIEALNNSLKENKLKISDKGIKSIRARVTNISEYLPEGFTISSFIEGLSNFLRKDCQEFSLSKEDICNIEKLKKEKYSTYEWNIGSSPKGSTKFEYKFNFGVLSLVFDLVKGKMQNVNVFGDFFSIKPIGEWAEKLNGLEFTKAKLKDVFVDVKNYIVNANGIEILEKIFE